MLEDEIDRKATWKHGFEVKLKKSVEENEMKERCPNWSRSTKQCFPTAGMSKLETLVPFAADSTLAFSFLFVLDPVEGCKARKEQSSHSGLESNEVVLRFEKRRENDLEILMQKYLDPGETWSPKEVRE